MLPPGLQSNLHEFLTKLDQKLQQPGNNCTPLMNVHQEAMRHLATDLNVILLSHQGTESRPWVAKGYSVANEVCTGPVGNGGVTPQLFDTSGRPYGPAGPSVCRLAFI